MSCAKARSLPVALFALMTAAAGAAESIRLPWGPTGVSYYNGSVDGFSESFPQGPNAIAATPGGNLLLADTHGDSVLVVDRSGKIVRRIGRKDGAALEQVSAVAPYGESEIVAGRARDGGIVRIDAAGTIHPFYSPESRAPGSIRQLQSLASDDAGRVYAGDVGGQRILIVSPKGAFLESVPWNLTGFVVTADGTLLTLERRSGKGYVLVARAANGTRADRFVIPTPGSGEVLPDDSDIASLPSDRPVFASPRLLGADAAGNLTIRHADPRRPGALMVRRYSADGSRSRQLGEIQACGAEDVFTVTADGRVLAMDYDAEKAPEGELTIREVGK